MGNSRIFFMSREELEEEGESLTEVTVVTMTTAAREVEVWLDTDEDRAILLMEVNHLLEKGENVLLKPRQVAYGRNRHPNVRLSTRARDDCPKKEGVDGRLKSGRVCRPYCRN